MASLRAELGTQPLAPPGLLAPARDPSPGPSLDGRAGTDATNSPPDAAGDAAEAPGEQPAPALGDIPIPVENGPPLAPDADGGPPPADAAIDNGPPDIESVAARRARAAARKRRAQWRIPLPVAIAALAVLAVTLLGWRKDVVRHAPQLASFYASIGLPVNLRGLAFTDVKIGNEIHDGVPVLVVEGMIVSTVSMPVDVPRLRFALRNAPAPRSTPGPRWPSQPVLEPGANCRSAAGSPPRPRTAMTSRCGSSRAATSSQACAEAAVARILIAEDEEPVRALVDPRARPRTVMSWWRPPTAPKRSTCCRARAAGFDLLLTDIKMPVMDGIALALAVARDFPSCRSC